MNRAVGQEGEGFEALLEPGLPPLQDEVVVGCQRYTAEGADKEGFRPVVGLGDLIRNKRASGRPKDAADAAALEKIAEGRGE